MERCLLMWLLINSGGLTFHDVSYGLFYNSGNINIMQIRQQLGI